MTKINKMVLKGFKSFGKRTELLFGSNFNCVLGPNGSGKSNVLDALCFVLGKAGSKGLRAEKAANLIYNGGKTKNPANEGEVSIYFDNSKKTFPTEDEMVKITRIIKNTGVSKYKINDKIRTRQQILDLLSIAKIDPDGYNIIMQGDIVKLVEMSSIERRQIIEEIAGISVYEDKKNKAIKELEKVDVKLKEADIILVERKTHLNELKKDRNQALKYKGLKDNISQNKASYLKIKIDAKDKKKKKNDNDIRVNNEKMKKLKDEIADIKKKIEGENDKIRKISENIERRGDKDQVNLHKEIEQLRVDLATAKNRIETDENEITKLMARKEQLQRDFSEMNNKIENLNNQIKDYTSEINKLKKEENNLLNKINIFKKKNNLEDASEIEKKIEDIDKDMENKQKEINSFREGQQNLLRETDRLDMQIRTTDEKIEKVTIIEKEHKSQLNKLKEMRTDFKKATLELNTRLNEDSTLAVEVSNARERLLKANEEHSKLELKNAGIKDSLASNVAIKEIEKNKSNLGNIYGTVAELGNVPTKYSLALEVAAGSKIKSMVVDNDATAAKCIKYLKQNRLGTASFIPLNKIKAISIRSDVEKLKSTKGVHDLAINLIDYDNNFKKVFSYVFGNTLIVDNIDVARRVGIGTAKMVTLEGDSAEFSGVMHGGFRHRKTGGFKEKEVTGRISELEKDISNLRETLSVLEKRRTDNEEEINSLRNRKHSLEGEVIKMEKSLHLEDSDLDSSKKLKTDFVKKRDEIDKGIEDIQVKINSLNSELIKNKTKKQELRQRVNELRNPTLLAELNTFEQKKNEIREEILKINPEIKGMESQIEINTRDNENIARILKQNEKEHDDFKKEITMLKDKIKGQEKILKEKDIQERKFHTKFKQLFTQKDKIDNEVRTFEGKMFNKNDSVRSIELLLNTASLNDANIKGELAGLYEDFKQYKDVKLVNKDEEQLKKEIRDFERIMGDLGSVNMRALDVYDEVEKQYKDLLMKKDTLISEKGEVVNMMNEIEGKKGGLFMKSFDSVNDHFKRIFLNLSTKGSAYLELENPEKPFEGGLVIKVRLTGNKFMDIMGLSGGEKTLTALAFIFSVQEHEPASFYILDEVDAALDKHNSEKLAKLLRSYSNKAQYVIISHNDAIISEADILYGVSMEKETGLSNVVSLKL